jgi:hypothetical protein
MQRTSRLAAAALAGLIATGSIAATLATAAPALADDHRGGWSNRDHGRARDDRGRFRERRYWHREYRRPVYDYPAPVYAYPAPAYPAYPYPYYQPSNGYIHVHGPGWGVGFSL